MPTCKHCQDRGWVYIEGASLYPLTETCSCVQNNEGKETL